jgi:hypothetical protein
MSWLERRTQMRVEKFERAVLNELKETQKRRAKAEAERRRYAAAVRRLREQHEDPAVVRAFEEACRTRTVPGLDSPKVFDDTPWNEAEPLVIAAVRAAVASGVG